MTQQGPADPAEKAGLNPQPLPPRWLPSWLPGWLVRLFGYAPRR